jgi:hypothetical protein
MLAGDKQRQRIVSALVLRSTVASGFGATSLKPRRYGHGPRMPANRMLCRSFDDGHEAFRNLDPIVDRHDPDRQIVSIDAAIACRR